MRELEVPGWVVRKDIHNETDDLDHEYDLYLLRDPERPLAQRQALRIKLFRNKREGRTKT
jgi:hypothetical protein